MESNGGYAVFQPIIETKCARVWLAKGGRKRFKVARIQQSYTQLGMEPI